MNRMQVERLRERLDDIYRDKIAKVRRENDNKNIKNESAMMLELIRNRKVKMLPKDDPIWKRNYGGNNIHNYFDFSEYKNEIQTIHDENIRISENEKTRMEKVDRKLRQELEKIMDNIIFIGCKDVVDVLANFEKIANEM